MSAGSAFDGSPSITGDVDDRFRRLAVSARLIHIRRTCRHGGHALSGNFCLSHDALGLPRRSRFLSHSGSGIASASSPDTFGNRSSFQSRLACSTPTTDSRELLLTRYTEPERPNPNSACCSISSNWSCPLNRPQNHRCLCTAAGVPTFGSRLQQTQILWCPKSARPAKLG